MRYQIVGQYIKITTTNLADAIKKATDHANDYAEDQEYEEVIGIQQISQSAVPDSKEYDFVYLVTYKNRVFERPREI